MLPRRYSSFPERNAGRGVDFRLEKRDTVYVELIPETEHSCRIENRNHSEQEKQLVVHACTESGLEAAVAISVEPCLFQHRN